MNKFKKKDNLVVIMAGGLGKRLKPLTDSCSKSMLKIGDKPILEIILNNFIKQGFYNFYISINYKGEQIKNYFKDGAKWGVNINYIHEKKMMGTAGSLSLISLKDDLPLIVINGDVLTTLSYDKLMDFHKKNCAKMTVVGKSYCVNIPYGIMKKEGLRLLDFEEKPVHKALINAGIYVLEAEAINNIPKNSYYNLDELIKKMLFNGDFIAVYEMDDYWIDIGTKGGLYQAKKDVYEVF